VIPRRPNSQLATAAQLGEPAGNSTNDDGRDPADLLLFPWQFLLAGAAKYPTTILLIRAGARARPPTACLRLRDLLVLTERRLRALAALEFARLHDGQVIRSLTLEDAACIDADLAMLVTKARSIAHQPTASTNSRKPKIVGSTWRAAKVRSWARRSRKNVWGPITFVHCGRAPVTRRMNSKTNAVAFSGE
jgi:hypothetical protein